MLNLSQFIVYSLWIGFISNAWWILNTQNLNQNAVVLLGIMAFLASVGWVIQIGFLLLVEFDGKD